MSRFANKVVLITGGTSGIGKSTALAFSQAGAKVVIAGRRANLGKSIVNSIEDQGGTAFFQPTDVTQEAQVQSLIQQTISRWGRIDVAFNNAGSEGEIFVPVTNQTVENFHAVMNTNVLGILLGMKYQIPVMLQSGGGIIINVASVAGVVGMPAMSVYSAAKHAVVGLTRSVALEVARQGIRINCISPGVIETEMCDRFEQAGSKKEVIEQLHPLGRIGQPEEIAKAVLFLASEDSSFMAGANLIVDGGWTAQ